MNKAVVITKAVLRSAEMLSVSDRHLAKIIGLSESRVSRMGKFALSEGGKPCELGLLFVRLSCLLDTIVGGDEAVARSWMRSENVVLGGRPLLLIQTVRGLANVIAYLDARRALA